MSSCSTSAPTIPTSGTAAASTTSTSVPIAATSTTSTSTSTPLSFEGFDDISFRLAYKKLRGDTITEEEMHFLTEAESLETPTIYKALLQKGNDYIHRINEDSSYVEKAFAELSLSGIIDLMDIEMEALYKKKYDDKQWALIKEAYDDMSLDNFRGMSELSLEYFSRIISLNSNVDQILSFVAKEKSLLIGNHKRGSNEYAMLRIMELVVENFTLWSLNQDGSELTFYRRFATALDILFTGTDFVLANGEQACKATKLSISFNKAAYLPFESPVVYGRKIDLLFKLGKSSKEKVEISSNEWKRFSVSEEMVLSQQAKNFRTDAAILKHLTTSYSCSVDSLLAMDFVGNFGYLYMLKYDERIGCFIAKVISTIIILISRDNFGNERYFRFFFKLKVRVYF